MRRWLPLLLDLWFPLTCLALAVTELFTDIQAIHGALAGFVTAISVSWIVKEIREFRSRRA